MSYLLDSLLTSDRRDDVERNDIDNALRHYTEVAHHAETLRKLRDVTSDLRRWRGDCLTPTSSRGRIVRLPLGAATVQVEVECTPASGDGYHEPFEPAGFDIAKVYINGHWCDPEDCIPAATLERWADEVPQMVADDEQAEADAAAEARAMDRVERFP